MAAVRLPPARERKRPNGDGFAPRPMIRIKKGAPPKGGCRGENPGGGNRSPPPPRRAQNPHRAAGADSTARPQPRRRRDSASSRWRGAWARPYTASAASGAYDLLTKSARPGKFYILDVKNLPPPHKLLDYGTAPGTALTHGRKEVIPLRA